MIPRKRHHGIAEQSSPVAIGWIQEITPRTKDHRVQAAVLGKLFHGRFLLFGLIGSGFANLLFALTSEYWSSMDYVVIMLFVAKILGQFVFISMIALYMNMCWTKVSATQFAVYMSLLNLGMSAGSGVLAALPNDISFETNFVIVSCLLFITAIGMFFYSQESHRSRIEALD